ncbi:hypothetical protein GCM10009721_02440 [Terrabacter tumescens]|uniref:Uncharacterized protein n=1 Tax=Terrabacter tumescens TaxID=60443 RepID=A0ABQ2HH63_9MICO|nr:hypothetical protein GCM10009721_02440 [Terrabacter tumescens]
MLSTTLLSPFETRETVCADTLARRATSAIETARRCPTRASSSPTTVASPNPVRACRACLPSAYAGCVRAHPASLRETGP